ncbi:GNAT family N-acetyltransferase [Egicoccus halophilus]|uniref:N-acetyltransferase domain-containing protein n=1 Tax=Egicoccus halophilus TaxID=1670830 RepID=A0A8J3EV83_9ACTN|nr:GNAT family N-acetyltransferase [Egicoccus halophilus]GGI07594.1 hypothetical protein GCM10011354_24870 [Egicoccus halophilus]
MPDLPEPAAAVRVEPLDAADAPTALALLEADETARGASLVDEAEHARLARLAGGGGTTTGWTPFVAHDADDEEVGYAGLLVAGAGHDTDAGSGSGGEAAGDAAALGTADDPGAVLQALLEALADAADAAGAARTQVWVRLAGEGEFAAAERAGFRVVRRLGVLGRELGDDLAVVAPREGWTIRASRPGADDEAVVAVLAAAYEGTDEAGWDLARLRERQAYDWFRPEDLLVAEDADGRLGGLHWLKRRSATQGEVYNLAVAPHAQGAGLGPALLTAGLAHLRGIGQDEVLLWVDRANDRAVRLYERNGFATRWDDVAFARTTGA